jgi:hypothetical protein
MFLNATIKLIERPSHVTIGRDSAARQRPERCTILVAPLNYRAMIPMLALARRALDFLRPAKE